MERTIFIGDVHGCADELAALLRECEVTPGDDVVLVGDLVAKGPSTRDVLAIVREGGLRSVRGNHDAHVLRFKAARDKGLPTPSMSPTHLQVAESLDDGEWAQLQALPLWLELPERDALVVHAGLVPGLPLEKQDPVMLMNMRSLLPDGTPSKKPNEGVLWGSRWPGPQRVFFGHHAGAGLQQHPFAIGLDTGCVYGLELTAYVLEEQRFVSVPARHAYAPITRESTT